MLTYKITKIVSSDDLSSIVVLLNTKTRDGHIAREVRITPRLWLISIELTDRGDAEMIRGFNEVA